MSRSIVFTPAAPATSATSFPTSAPTSPSLPGFADLARAIAGQYPAPHGFLLRLEDTVLRVRSNSPALAADLRAYFGPFAEEELPGARADMLFLLLEAPAVRPPVPLAPKPHLPGKRPDKERFADVPGGRVVRKQATGMLFLFGHGPLHQAVPNIAIGPCAANRNQLVNFLCSRYMERRVAKGWLLGHAAGVVHRGAELRGEAQGGKALALCGFAGMGKSTLALHLVARGFDFLSNDRVLVEPGDLVSGGVTSAGTAVLHGIPKHPRLNPGTALGNPALAPLLSCALPPAARAAYADLGPEELRVVEDKYDALIDECFAPVEGHSRFTLAAPLAGVVVLNWTHGGGPLEARRVNLAERPDLLEAFRKAPGVFYLPQALATPAQGGKARLDLADYVAALGHLPALELAGGADFEAATAACMEFLGHQAPANA